VAGLAKNGGAQLIVSAARIRTPVFQAYRSTMAPVSGRKAPLA
jgi:hypothetical protein